MSGLIYAVIIILWAGYLGSMVLRRHDENESRSVDRFSTAMRILARRNRPAADRRYVVASPGNAVRGQQRPFVKGDRQQAARLRVMRRRRSALALVVVLTLTVAGLAAAGVVPRWSVAVAGTVFIAYLLHLRLQAHHARAASRRSPAADRRQAVGGRPAFSAASPRTRADQRSQPVRLPQYEIAEAAARVANENVLSWDDDEDSWQPRPWPLPTYVNAPVAPPTTRTIDLGRGTDEESADSLVAATSVGDIDGLDLPTPADEDILDEIPDRRRAVGD